MLVGGKSHERWGHPKAVSISATPHAYKLRLFRANRDFLLSLCGGAIYFPQSYCASYNLWYEHSVNRATEQ